MHAGTGVARARAPARSTELPSRGLGAETLSILNKLRLLAETQVRLCASAASLRRTQLRLLRRALARAYRDVPLYRARFDAAGVHPRELTSVADLARFPMTEKDDIRDAFPHGCIVRGADLAKCRIQPTSGSSGQCMEVALGRVCDDHRTLATQRIYAMQGFRPWHRMAYIYPFPLPLMRNLGLYRSYYFHTATPPGELLADLRAVRPHFLAATPSDLFDLCDATDADLTSLGLRAVCVHSEPMSDDERRCLADRFGCRVATNYYCTELWGVAGECTEHALHQLSDNVVVEIVDDTGRPVPRGEVGHVLLTSLRARVQPFIRYRIGDLAAWDASDGPCVCGSALPRLARLEGRDDDYIVYPNGERLHPSKITVAVKSPCFRFASQQIFRDYRITQDGPSHVHIHVVPGRDARHFAECAEQGRKNLADLLGPSFAVTLARVARLDRGTGGKRKIVERTCDVRASL
jgi:phenylacetate-CoA ligase